MLPDKALLSLEQNRFIPHEWQVLIYHNQVVADLGLVQ